MDGIWKNVAIAVLSILGSLGLFILTHPAMTPEEVKLICKGEITNSGELYSRDQKYIMETMQRLDRNLESFGNRLETINNRFEPISAHHVGR